MGRSASKVDDVTALPSPSPSPSPSRHKMADVLLWQRYDNNKMVAMRYYGNVILHLQQYSHRLNLFYYFHILVETLTVDRHATSQYVEYTRQTLQRKKRRRRLRHSLLRAQKLGKCRGNVCVGEYEEVMHRSDTARTDDKYVVSSLKMFVEGPGVRTELAHKTVNC